MSINTTLSGDLVQMADKGQFDLIVHGCNCFCTMGAGIALTIKNNWIEAYNADLKTAKGDANKLGSYSSVIVDTKANKKSLTIINMYTQYDIGYSLDGIPPVDYTAIHDGFFHLNKQYKDKRRDGKKLKVGIPYIGAGLAGGDWEAIERLINVAAPDLDITLVKYVPPTKVVK